VTVAGRVVLGGTFDHLHAGHEALLATAFRTGARVAIGLTTPAYLTAHPKPTAEGVQPYPVRRRALARWLAARYPRARWEIRPISDRFGGSIDDGVAALVVSADTLQGGRAVNAERRRRGRGAVPIRVVPLALADDLEPISSRRIRADEIDRNGRRRARIRVAVDARRPDDRHAAEEGLRRAFRRAVFVGSRFARGSAAPELRLRITRSGSSRVRLRLASRRVRLAPVVVRARTPAELQRAVARLVRPPASARGGRTGRVARTA